MVWVGEREFRVDDGSGLYDEDPSEPGVKVLVPEDVTLPSIGSVVSVTGISSCELRGTRFIV